MKSYFKSVSLGLLLAATALASTCAFAQTSAGPAPIRIFNAGWGSDEFTLGTGSATANPANCPNNDLYNVSSANNGYKTYLATVLTAISTGQNITVIVHNTQCSNGGRPLIYGVQINP